MKRLLSLYVLIFYICTLAIPYRSFAILPLAAIPAAQIGAAVACAALVGSATKAAINNYGSYQANSADITTISAPLVYYNTVMQAGAQIALGATFQAVLDVEELYNSGAMTASAAFSDLLSSIFPSDKPAPVVGTIYPPSYFDGINPDDSNTISSTGGYFKLQSSQTYSGWHIDHSYYHISYAYDTGIPVFMHVYTKISETKARDDYYSFTTSSPTYTNPSTGLPQTLTNDQAASIAAALPAAAAASPAVKNALSAAIAANPSLVSSPPAITAADIAAAVQSGTAAANQTLVDTLTALVAANPTDAALQAELAKALAEQAKEQLEDVEETFNPLSPSGFGEAYNPGEFDIPARFTTFLQNVKSSGLFSFSSSFFNSLPGGGSPLLTINGGQTFGTHTFDFSQSLGGGLTILKSVLLALFGFLSIRAVIMKR